MAWEDEPRSSGLQAIYEATFIDTAASLTDSLRVRVPGFDDGVHAFEVMWMPRDAVLPVAGDRAVVVEAVALDGDSTVWAVVCWEPSY